MKLRIYRILNFWRQNVRNTRKYWIKENKLKASLNYKRRKDRMREMDWKEQKTNIAVKTWESIKKERKKERKKKERKNAKKK